MVIIFISLEYIKNKNDSSVASLVCSHLTVGEG